MKIYEQINTLKKLRNKLTGYISEKLPGVKNDTFEDCIDAVSMLVPQPDKVLKYITVEDGCYITDSWGWVMAEIPADDIHNIAYVIPGACCDDEDNPTHKHIHFTSVSDLIPVKTIKYNDIVLTHTDEYIPVLHKFTPAKYYFKEDRVESIAGIEKFDIIYI